MPQDIQSAFQLIINRNQESGLFDIKKALERLGVPEYMAADVTKEIRAEVEARGCNTPDILDSLIETVVAWSACRLEAVADLAAQSLLEALDQLKGKEDGLSNR